MLQLQTKTEQYWAEQFQITDEDIEYIFNVFLETETPLPSSELAKHVIERRFEQEKRTLRRQIEQGDLYQPKHRHEVGQSLTFPAMGYQSGEVVAERLGHNPEHGEFSVIKVTFETGEQREFASNLSSPHALNLTDESQLQVDIAPDDIENLLHKVGDDIIYLLEERLRQEEDAVYFAGRWFLKSLLAEVNVAHLHLTEAVLVMNEGGPLDTKSILAEIDLPQEVNTRLQVFSLDHALFNDPRFDEVGPAGKVLWYLKDMEPPEVSAVPDWLRYESVEYNWQVLTDELASLEREIDDELSVLRSPARPADAVTFSLNYPHRRAGTLPLNSRLRHLFPTAYEAPRILMTLVDGQTGEEMIGWVVREHRYVYGLGDFYRRHKLPVGVYLTVKRTDDPARVIVDFQAHRPRTEWIRLAVPQEHTRLSFENEKRAIGAEYDDLMVLGTDDLSGLDSLWISPASTRPSLADTMRDVISELQGLTPQNAVHAKTIYSTVNILRRCPPGPIFATLVAHPEFAHVGGPYWRVS